MGNMCCRREVYAPNGTEADQSRCGQQHQKHHLSKHPEPAMSSAYHSAGDDCAINELLEGRMDLDVLMPDGRQVRLTVERRTPMMDLLVQAASATKISPGGHVIHVFGEGDKGNGTIHYKPSTPIGSLDTKTICIVPKKEVSDHLAKKAAKTANRPFEPTFRVQVHLPRNQLTVLRVSPRIKISDLKGMVCKEKGLDTGRYQLVRPSGPAQPLAGDMTLAEYGSTEITLLSNSSIESHICNSTSHIIPYSKRAEESKRKNGILRLLTEDAINKANEASNCNSAYRLGTRHHEKISQPEHDAHVHHHQYRYKPKKRRPAPPPPPPALPSEAPSHSRQSSSDSSGYHEATSSFLHEEHSGEEKASSDSSGVSSLEVQPTEQQPSPPPPMPNSKKKKAPAPPPPSRLKERPVHRQAPACPNPSRRATSVALRDSEESTVHVTETELDRQALDFSLPQKDSIKDPVVLLQTSIHRQAPACPNPSGKATSVALRDSEESTVHITKTELDRQALDLGLPQKDSIKDPVVLLQTSIHRQAPACPNPSKQTTSSVPRVSDAEESSAAIHIKTEPAIDRQALDCLIPLKDSTGDRQAGTLDCIPLKDSIKDPVVSLQIVESEASSNNVELPRKSPSPTAEFTISTYSASRRTTGSLGQVISEDNLVRKDNSNPLILRENSGISASEDRISILDHVIPTDHVIPKDPVPKRDAEAEKKLDLPHLWESEGRRHPQMTVAAKDLPAASVSTTGPVKDRDIKYETPLTATENKNSTTSLVPDTYKYRTSEKKVEEDLLNYKGEAVSTRVALVALNARIEQDVTQQEIASSIQAAFHSVDFTPQPSLLAIKQRNSDVFRPEGAPESSPQTAVRVRPSDDPPPRCESPKELTEREALLIDEEDSFSPPAPPSSIRRTSSSKNLKRSSSLLNFADVPRNASLANSRRARQLQRSLTDLSTDGKEDFEAEQQRLQQEYIKLQRQFLVWQQQLMNNHAMLREECIVPQYARTLRQSHSLPEGEDSFEETAPPSVPLVSRSLSYEPTRDRCSTLPRSAINITSLEFGSLPLNNGTSTLRSSKTKSYFKPPQVRTSTKSRQRLPPEIKREGDVDITDDAKMLTTILPSFESLKLIAENHVEAQPGVVARTRDAKPGDSPTGWKVPHQLSSTFPKLNSRLVNNGGDRDLKCVNGNTTITGLSVFRADCSPKAATEQSAKSQPPPPPPPPPSSDGGGVSKRTIVENCTTTTKSTGQRNGVGKKDFTSSHVEDPREQLMLEIRKFGGRTALRKISLAS